MEDVLEVYHRPYHPLRPVVCLDERPKLLHGTPRGVLPARPGRAARQDYEYERHGSCNVFLWVEPLVGTREVQVTARRTSLDFAEQLRHLSDEVYPQAERIVLVVDNLSTHTAAALYKALCLRKLTAWPLVSSGTTLRSMAPGSTWRSVSSRCSLASVWRVAWPASKT